VGKVDDRRAPQARCGWSLLTSDTLPLSDVSRQARLARSAAPGSHPGPFVGHLINTYIYEQLPTGILRELAGKNPTVADRGHRRYKPYQPTGVDTGSSHLDRQVAVVTTLMRVSPFCQMELSGIPDSRRRYSDVN